MNYADIHTYGDVMISATHRRKLKGFVLPSPTMLMAAVIIALSISNVIFVNLYRSTANEYAEYKADVFATQEQIRLDNERKLAELAETNKWLDRGWADAQSELDRLGRVIRVRPHSCQGAVPAVPGATGKPNEAAEAGTISAAECEAYLDAGIKDATQLIWLQRWIRETREVTK